MEKGALKQNACQQIRVCPASHYLFCAAYKRGVNCWEAVGKPCCKRNDPKRCKDCWVYQAWHAAQSAQAGGAEDGKRGATR